MFVCHLKAFSCRCRYRYFLILCFYFCYSHLFVVFMPLSLNQTYWLLGLTWAWHCYVCVCVSEPLKSFFTAPWTLISCIMRGSTLPSLNLLYDLMRFCLTLTPPWSIWSTDTQAHTNTPPPRVHPGLYLCLLKAVYWRQIVSYSKNPVSHQSIAVSRDKKHLSLSCCYIRVLCCCVKTFFFNHLSIVFCVYLSFSVTFSSVLLRYVVPSGLRGHLQGGLESAREPQASDPAAREPRVHCGLHQDHAAQPGPGADGENHQPGQNNTR